MDYKTDVIIDESALDVEWINQPKLAIKYGIVWAELKRDLEYLEENLKVKTAELVDAVNSDPAKYLGEGVKPTLGNIDSFVIQDDRIKILKKKIIESRFEVEMANIAKNEICFSRKTALENLVRLHGQNYFSSPSAPRDLSTELRNKMERENRDSKIAKKLHKPN